MPSNHCILCHPLILPPSIFPNIRVFSNESALCIRWTKYWSFSFNISPSNENPVLISFRMDRLDLLAVQGTLKSLFQHHSSKASILHHSAFCTVQLSHPYMTTGKTIALTRRTFVDKVMSLLFNMLSRVVITFFPRSKYLLISWLQSPSAVILEPKKIKSATVSTVYPSICHEVMGPVSSATPKPIRRQYWVGKNIWALTWDLISNLRPNCNSLPLWVMLPLLGYLTSLNLGFLVCKIEMTASQNYDKNM